MTVAQNDEKGVDYRQGKQDSRTAAREKKDIVVWRMRYTEEGIHSPSIWADGSPMHSPEQEQKDSFDEEQD